MKIQQLNIQKCHGFIAVPLELQLKPQSYLSHQHGKQGLLLETILQAALLKLFCYSKRRAALNLTQGW